MCSVVICDLPGIRFSEQHKTEYVMQISNYTFHSVLKLEIFNLMLLDWEIHIFEKLVVNVIFA